MFKLDNQLLVELGLGSLPAEEKNKMLAHIYETLEMRVGMKLAEQMTDAQLDEFEGFIDRNDEAGALTWLETNFPNYKQVVADELEKLKGEIKASAPQIVAAAAEAGQQLSPPQPPVDSSQFPQQPPATPSA
jgi:predicted RNA-binding Zn ribbon-like protein